MQNMRGAAGLTTNFTVPQKPHDTGAKSVNKRTIAVTQQSTVKQTQTSCQPCHQRDVCSVYATVVLHQCQSPVHQATSSSHHITCTAGNIVITSHHLYSRQHRHHIISHHLYSRQHRHHITSPAQQATLSSDHITCTAGNIVV